MYFYRFFYVYHERDGWVDGWMINCCVVSATCWSFRLITGVDCDVDRLSREGQIKSINIYVWIYAQVAHKNVIMSNCMKRKISWYKCYKQQGVLFLFCFF